MFVKIFELLGDVWIWIDFFECIVLLQSEELSKFVECATIPVTILVSFCGQFHALPKTCSPAPHRNAIQKDYRYLLTKYFM
jgi:hypothetical protein